MSKVCAFLAEGLEEVECLAVVDILRRSGVQVELVSVTGSLMVTGSHAITIRADALFEDSDFSDCSCLFLPGGVPGTPNLAAHAGLKALLKQFAEENRRISAICAAPSIPGSLGLLKGKKATCYPGWEDQLIGAEYTGSGVQTDGNITTGRGLGFAIDLGLELAALLASPEKAARVKAGIQHPDTI